jgi:hypothetical protein
LDKAVEISFTAGTDNNYFTALASLGVTMTERFESTRSIETAVGRSRETSDSFITTLTEATSNSISVTIDRDDPIGHYRYAWYAVSDVYFIISTNRDNTELYTWDVIAAQREGITGRFEYSVNGRFDNSPLDNLIVFAEDFWKSLPTPRETTYRLITDLNIPDAGTILRTPNAIRYDAGTYVMLTAIPKSAYRFDKWEGPGVPTGMANNAGIIITIDSDLSLTANFESIPVFYELTTNVNVSGRGTISIYPDTGPFAPNQQVLVTATPAKGYGFINWTGTGAPVGTAASNPTITVTMNDNLTLTANFGVEGRLERTFNATSFAFSPDHAHHSWSLPNNVRFPATIEVYALGAGGGGQGGSKLRMAFESDRRGTGASGGGGAAAYMRFTTNEQVHFIINVGNRGQGGEGRYFSGQDGVVRRGHPGTVGKSTTVSVAGYDLVVAGGSGGGGNGSAHVAGMGGVTSTIPPGISSNNWQSNPGFNGQPGGHNVFLESRGGRSGGLTNGSLAPFDGGLAPFNSGGIRTSDTYTIHNTVINNNIRFASNLGAGGSGGHSNGNRGVAGGAGVVRVVVTWIEL